jgi:hypothetical protein
MKINGGVMWRGRNEILAWRRKLGGAAAAVEAWRLSAFVISQLWLMQHSSPWQAAYQYPSLMSLLAAILWRNTV